MWVREVMTRWPVTVTPDTSVKEALRLLDEHAITSMPVVGSDDEVCGVVSEADLVRDALPHDVRSHLLPPDDHRSGRPSRVADVMNHHPVTVHGDLDLADAVELMTSTSVKSVPVVDARRRVVGMISRRDIVHLLARADERVERDVDSLYRSMGVDWLVEVHEGVVTVQGPVGTKARSLAETAAATVPGVVAVSIAP